VPPPFGFAAPPFGGAPFPGSEVPSPLDAEIQVVLREIHGEMQVLEQSGEYGEQFKNARRLLATGFNSSIVRIRQKNKQNL
jgi:hypothetical protein